jgi:hypothetical protein
MLCPKNVGLVLMRVLADLSSNVINRNRVRLRVKLMSPKPLYGIFNCKGA